MATLKTSWVKRLVNGVLTKTFAFAHVKSTYYNYTNNVTLQDKLDKMDATLVPVTTAGSGSAYTATISGVTELYVGLKITIIPHVVSASTAPTLNLNSLGAKKIAMLTNVNWSATVAPTLATWLSAGKPIELTYNGENWIVDMRRPSASSLYGQVPIENGGTGLTESPSMLIDLESTSAANVLEESPRPGVTGILQITNGGTGAASAEEARENLGIITPDEIVNLYVWKKYEGNPLYTETEVTKQAISIKSTATNDYQIVYGSEITVADDVVSLVDEQEITVTSAGASQLADIKGKYVSWSGSVYFIPTTATLKEEASTTGTYMRASKATKITVNTNDTAPLQYVASKENDTYPTDGEHTDGYWYVYHKQVGE